MQDNHCWPTWLTQLTRPRAHAYIRFTVYEKCILEWSPDYVSGPCSGGLPSLFMHAAWDRSIAFPFMHSLDSTTAREYASPEILLYHSKYLKRELCGTQSAPFLGAPHNYTMPTTFLSPFYLSPLNFLSSALPTGSTVNRDKLPTRSPVDPSTHSSHQSPTFN